MPAPLVIVDAENVRRSRWPNLSAEELVDGARAWAVEEGVRLLVVFDGRPPEAADDLVRAARGESADDRIAAIAGQLAAEGAPYWLVTSDRELRRRAGDAAARVVGGGSFLARLGGAG